MNEFNRINPPANLWDLPGFREAKERIEAKGYKAGWLTQIPDINDPYTFFKPNKKSSNYYSNCPCNEGFYLGGVNGAVKCSGCTTILPGHMWHEMCDKDYKTCPFYMEPQAEPEPEQLALFA